jgi:hypothetical protein
MKATRPCPLCGLALPGQRCGWCHGTGVVVLEFATRWDGIKWHLFRLAPALRRVLGPVQARSGSSPEGTQ